MRDEFNLPAVKTALGRNYRSLREIFRWYATASTGWPFQIGLNAFTEFAHDAKLKDDEHCQTKDLDTIFISSNVEKVKEHDNHLHALTRFEFVEAVVRIAVARYAKSKRFPDILEASDAVEKLIEADLLPVTPYEGADDFRREQLYPCLLYTSDAADE